MTLSRVDVQRIAGGGNNDTRVLVRQGTTEIKIETCPVSVERYILRNFGRSRPHAIDLHSRKPSFHDD